MDHVPVDDSAGHRSGHLFAGHAFLTGAFEAGQKVGVEGDVIGSPVGIPILLHTSVVLLAHGVVVKGGEGVDSDQSFMPAVLLENGFDFAMGAGNDVGRNKAVANTLASIGSSPHSCVHSARFAANENGDVAATDKFTTNQPHLGGFGHGVSRLDGGYKTAGFDHAEGDAHGFVGHCLFRGGKVRK